MNSEEKILQAIFDLGVMHIRKLARVTKLNPNTVIRITDKLEKEELVKKEKDETNKVNIKPGENELYKFKKIAYNIEKLYKSGLISYLNTEYSYPTLILFGSYAKGENHPDSDIDLFIIADEKKKLDLSKFERKLDAEIQTFIHTPEEMKKLVKTNKELINNVVNGRKLTGYLEVIF